MDKRVIILVASVGGMLGAYIPMLLGAASLSGWSILGSFIGGLLGVWVGVKLSQ
ncbi:hypothetical protein KC973_02015 [Candidatus Saccharibacteria bacterium]|nr:hypothetical protein [Candidatus Saccharibacteria bacterium]